MCLPFSFLCWCVVRWLKGFPAHLQSVYSNCFKSGVYTDTSPPLRKWQTQRCSIQTVLWTAAIECAFQSKLDSVTRELFPLSSPWCPLDQISWVDKHGCYRHNFARFPRKPLKFKTRCCHLKQIRCKNVQCSCSQTMSKDCYVVLTRLKNDIFKSTATQFYTTHLCKRICFSPKGDM